MATQNSVNNSLGTTAYAVICGGTTATGNVQPVASLGSSGQVLTSNGAGALPSFQAAAGDGLVFISSQSASNQSAYNFTSIGSYVNYLLLINVVPVTSTAILQIEVSSDNGGSYITSGYSAGCISMAYNSATNANNNSTAAYVLSGSAGTSGVSGRCSAEVTLTNINSSGRNFIHGTCAYITNAGASNVGRFGGDQTTSTINAFRVKFSSGNIDSGYAKLYGYKNS